MGDPLDPETQHGPIVSPAQAGKIRAMIAQGQAAGARILCGGPGEGAFVPPTVFTDASDDMVIARDEIFGPVMTTLSFRDEDEVIGRANDTGFGLAAGVFTRDLARGHRVAAALEAGTCWINAYNLTPVEMPFGGVKLSGLGRENSAAAIEHYSQLKSVYVGMGGVEAPY
jgi:betaine-aldehyde dehydrogenase